MNFALRIVAITIAFTGLVSSSFAPATSSKVPNHVAAYSSGPGPLGLPVPTCPGMPGCPPSLAASLTAR